MRVGPYESLSEWERFAGEIGWPIVTRDKVTVGNPGRASVVYDAIIRTAPSPDGTATVTPTEWTRDEG